MATNGNVIAIKDMELKHGVQFKHGNVKDTEKTSKRIEKNTKHKNRIKYKIIDMKYVSMI